MTTAAIAGAGSGMQVAGQLVSAIEAKRIGKHNQSIAEANAQAESLALLNDAAQQDRLVAMLEDEQRFSRQVERFEAARLDEALRHEEGSLRAIMGASGLDVDSGSPLVALEHQAQQAEVTRLAQQFQFKLERRALREETTQREFAADQLRFQAGERLRLGGQQAGLIGMEAQTRQTASLLGAVGSGITGAQTIRYLQAGQPKGTTRRSAQTTGVPSAAAIRNTPVTSGGGFAT